MNFLAAIIGLAAGFTYPLLFVFFQHRLQHKWKNVLAAVGSAILAGIATSVFAGVALALNVDLESVWLLGGIVVGVLLSPGHRSAPSEQ